jgi:hypothetical protein
MKIMVKWQTVILFIVIIVQLINQNHCSLCLYIFNKHFINNKIIKWKTHNNDVKLFPQIKNDDFLKFLIW